MIIKTEGLVIKEQIVGESDKLLTILTADEGIIRAFARRAKKINDSKSSATGLLAYSRFSIFKGRDKYIIDEAKIIDVFFGLRKDIILLSLAQYFCELAFILVPEGIDSKEHLRLILNSISFLAKGKKDPMLIKVITELRFMSKSGYMPNLVACRECACFENENWYFCADTGDICCADCMKEVNSNNYQISQSILTAMRHVVFSDFNKIYSFNLTKEATNRLCEVAEQYTLHILGKMPMTLDFFKMMNVENK